MDRLCGMILERQLVRVRDLNSRQTEVADDYFRTQAGHLQSIGTVGTAGGRFGVLGDTCACDCSCAEMWRASFRREAWRIDW